MMHLWGGGLFESKGEIMDAVRARGLHAALYFSLYEWFHPLYKGPNPHQYVEQVCKNKETNKPTCGDYF